MTGWWNDRLMKWQVDEMTGWWNDRLIKWHAIEVIKWWNDILMKWQVDEMTGWWNDRLMKCLGIFNHRKKHSGKKRGRRWPLLCLLIAFQGFQWFPSGYFKATAAEQKSGKIEIWEKDSPTIDFQLSRFSGHSQTSLRTS